MTDQMERDFRARIIDGMHVAGCECRPALPYTAGACTPGCEGPNDPFHQDLNDTACLALRARLRGEK